MYSAEIELTGGRILTTCLVLQLLGVQAQQVLNHSLRWQPWYICDPENVVEMYMYSAEMELKLMIGYWPLARFFNYWGSSGTAGSSPSTRMIPWRHICGPCGWDVYVQCRNRAKLAKNRTLTTKAKLEEGRTLTTSTCLVLRLLGVQVQQVLIHPPGWPPGGCLWTTAWARHVCLSHSPTAAWTGCQTMCCCSARIQ